MGVVQLNVWIPEGLSEHLKQRSKEEGRAMNRIIAELIVEDIARRRNEFIERDLVTIIQEMIKAEFRRASTQLRCDLRADCEYLVESSLDNLYDQYDWLVDLILSSARNVRIVRRLVYVSLVKAYDSSVANEVYDEAKAQAQQEFPKRRRSRRKNRKE